ncbi:hypothetical protein GCM10010421_16690 [Streptomyces glaucus]|uniref:Secreted protein n=1 Tax=Streptomyces glaucus TaxID=284029 RepID=A0ABP5WKB9_9ACTN
MTQRRTGTERTQQAWSRGPFGNKGALAVAYRRSARSWDGSTRADTAVMGPTSSPYDGRDGPRPDRNPIRNDRPRAVPADAFAPGAAGGPAGGGPDAVRRLSEAVQRVAGDSRRPRAHRRGRPPAAPAVSAPGAAPARPVRPRAARGRGR